MKENFGILPDGQSAALYTISCGGVTASVTDYGAALVKLLVPDADGKAEDVVLGYDDVEGYRNDTVFLGATVGRSANRIKGGQFRIGSRSFQLDINDNINNLHSGMDFYSKRVWQAEEVSDTAVTFHLHSPNGDQGFPGNAEIRVTYLVDDRGNLHIIYNAVSDQDTVFNLTNHSYFNLAGHQNTGRAMDQELSIPGRFYCMADEESIPTGELRPVAGTPMDFRSPKPIGRDLEENYESLKLQGGYDHSWEVFCNPCAILHDPASGRTMAVNTDLPGVQFYCGNFLEGQTGKGGVAYVKRSGVCLETQYHPDSVHHPEWVQPFTKAGEPYHSETVFRFSVEK